MTELADCIENREKAAAAEKGAEKRIVKMFRAFRGVPCKTKSTKSVVHCYMLRSVRGRTLVPVD